jgi:hypothetical protein
VCDGKISGNYRSRGCEGIAGSIAFTPLKMTVIIRSLRWVFVFVALFLLLEVHATGEKETGVNDTTDRLVSVLARQLLTLY